MEEQKLVSIDLLADFGFLKKPDYNVGLQLSYNMLHKPALLGILGAVIGLAGYTRKGEFPEYYQKLKDLPVGIQPLRHEKGNFQKTSVKYSNTVGYANADGNLLVEETMLVRPGYRCYLLLTLAQPEHARLYVYLKDGHAEYIPYLGKNEFQACWMDAQTGESTFQEYVFEVGKVAEAKSQILTLFRRDMLVRENMEEDEDDYNPFELMLSPSTFVYFERLPAGFNESLHQYALEEYTYSNLWLKAEAKLPQLYYLSTLQSYVQLL